MIKLSQFFHKQQQQQKKKTVKEVINDVFSMRHFLRKEWNVGRKK